MRYSGIQMYLSAEHSTIITIIYAKNARDFIVITSCQDLHTFCLNPKGITVLNDNKQSCIGRSCEPRATLRYLSKGIEIHLQVFV